VKREAGAKRARLQALAVEWSLDTDATRRLADLLALVSSDQRAATSVRAPAVAVDVHVADSLAALPWINVPSRVADIGSGAGFPGLALAIARPGLQVDLVESVQRKCMFLQDAARALGLAGVQVVNSRAEDWARGDGAERYDRVLARAVGPLPTLVEYAAPLLAAGGMLIAWKGAPDRDEERAGERAADRIGMKPVVTERVHPYAGSRAHHLHLYEKVGPTPPEFPRRAGAARKHPLG